MSEQFYTILTKQGKAALTEASISGNKVEFTHIALGDSGGSYYNPSESQTSLRREVHRSSINHVRIHQVNDNWIKITAIVPATTGGFMIREIGLYDSSNTLIAVGKYPETYKPILDDGSSKDVIINMIIEVNNAETVNLKVDPTVVLVSQQDLENHISDDMPHTFKDLKTGKSYRYGQRLSSEGKPQTIYKEEL